MRKVHWSVWGLLGFFGMLVVGLWIDSYWLPGVGVLAPVTVISSPVPVRQVQERVATPPREEEQTENADPFQNEATSAGHDPAAGLEAPEIIGGGLEIPGLEISVGEPPAELLPEPETEGVPSDSSLAPPIPDAPPARDPAVTSKPAPQRTSEAKCPPPPPGADDHDPQLSAVLELLQSIGVTTSREFAPDAQSQAQHMRKVAEAVCRRLEQDRATPPIEVLPPPRPRLDLTTLAASPPSEPIRVGAPSAEQVGALRDASRQLDEIANQLEQQGLYPRADEVRRLSQEMRIDARKGPQQRSPVTSVPPSSVPPSQYYFPGSLRPSGDQPYNPYENPPPGATPGSSN